MASRPGWPARSPPAPPRRPAREHPLSLDRYNDSHRPAVNVEEIEARLDPRQALSQLGFPVVGEPERVLGGWDTLLWHFATPDGREHSLRVYHLPQRKEVAWRESVALETCAGAAPPP